MRRTPLSHALGSCARPWVLVLTRPERSPTVGRSRPRWLRWHADERKGILVFKDVVSPVDIREHIRFLGGSSKNTCVFAWVMAIYAELDGLRCQRDGFSNRELEVDHLWWHAADPPLDCGPSEDGGVVSGTEPP